MSENLVQGSDAWKDARLGCATASRFGDILAVTKSGYAATRHNYMAQLVVERITGQAEESYINAAMQHGIETEPQARAAFELATGLDVQEVGFIKLGDWIGASPDGIIGDDAGLEIKCPQKSTHMDTLLGGRMPLKHVPQVQGSMWVTGRKRWHFVSYHPAFPQHLRLFHQVIERDDTYIVNLALEVQKFCKEVADAVKVLAELNLSR